MPTPAVSRRSVLAGLAAAGAALPAAPWVARAAEPVTLRVSHFLPPTSTAQRQLIEP